jgi:hypothetical protein
MVGIETGIDKLLDLVQEKKKLTVSEAAKKLKVSESKIESWGKVLSDENIIEFTYPSNPLNPPFLRAFSKEEAKKKEEGTEDIPVEKPEKKEYPKRNIRKSKAVSLKFFSRFRSKKKSKKKRSPLPYILLLVAVIVVIMYFTGVIEWLISLLSP